MVKRLFVAVLMMAAVPTALAQEETVPPEAVEEKAAEIAPDSLDAAALWQRLRSPEFAQGGSLADLTLRRDEAEIVFQQGRLALDSPLPGRPSMAYFQGSGRLSIKPSLSAERDQLALHAKEATVDAEFTEALLFFGDGTGGKFSQALQSQDGSFRPDLDRLRKLRRHGLDWDARLLKALLASQGSHHAFLAAEIKTRKHGWLSFCFDEFDPEELELINWRESHRSRDVWVKYPKDGRTPQEVFQDPVSHQETVVRSYKIDVTVEKNTELRATVDVTFDQKRAGERVLLFAMTPDLQVSSVKDQEGNELTFLQPEKDRDDVFYNDYLAVVAPQPWPQGSHQLTFQYAGKKVVEEVGGGNFFCRSFGWYPSYGMGRPSINENAFATRKDFEITLSVPKRYDAVSVGEKLSDQKEGDQRITRWKSEIPLAVAGFAFGDYKIETHDVGDVKVEVYANARGDDFLRRIEHLASPGIGQTRSAVNLGSLSPGRMAGTMAVEVGNSLRVMQTYFGPYPYKKLAVSNIPFSYGQGWPSLLYLSTATFLDSTQRHQLGIDDAVGITDYFRAHETSHQWWGHVVGWKSYRDQWLSEGFAQFSGNLYAWYSRSPKEYFERMRKDRELFMHGDGKGSYNVLGPIYMGRRLSSAEYPRGYSALVYEKGGWVLHMLRMMFYDPNSKQPDERFIAMMKDFTKTHFNQPASTEDFKKVVEKHMLPMMNIDGDGSMDWFFDAWVYGNQIPKYELEFSIQPDQQEGKWTVSGKLHQREVNDDFRAPVPLYLHLNGQVMRLGFLTSRGAMTPFNIPGLGFKPDKVTINEWDDMLVR
ncbi:MAG TPA: M1 family aminopeptidase [Acidobacteriota bacterium]|nr:M1 family aminopeptidase [Acidobacteriota bacterium]